MANCRDIESLLAPYVDGEITEGEHARVDEHLEACDACRGRRDAESAARTLLRVRTPGLLERAPLDLRARCARAAHPAPPTRRAWIAVRSTGLAVAATLLLAVGGLFAYGVIDQSGTALAAELALDHLKCFALLEGASRAPDAHRLETSLLATYGWHIRVPQGSPAEGLQLVGGRRCFAGDSRVAHILYRHDGHPLSLFVVPRHAYPPRALTLLGHRTRIWSHGGSTYVLVASAPESTMERVSRYIRSTIDGR
jgi:anti-sigma factor RsiW